MHPHNHNEQDHSLFVRHRGPVTCVAGIPNRNAAVTSGYDSAVGYAEHDTGTVRLLGYHDHLANKITVNDAGTRAASCSSDYTIYIWNLETRQVERILKGHSDDVEDFVFVDDVVRANLRAAKVPGAAGGVFNVGGGKAVSVIELVESLQSLIPGSPPADFGPARAGDIRYSQADLARAEAGIGYQPLVDLPGGLAATVDWFRDTLERVGP